MEQVKIIDSHQHFWQYDQRKHAWINDDMQVLRKNYLPEAAKDVMQEAGVDYCIAVQADQTDAETKFLLQLAAEHLFIKGVVGWIDLRADDIDEQLASYCEQKLLKGFRHVVQEEPDDEFLLRDNFQRGISSLHDYGYAYDVLIFPKQLDAAIRFCQKNGGMRLVIDHGAKPNLKDADTTAWLNKMKQFTDMPHVYCKLSGLVTEADWTNWSKYEIFAVFDALVSIFGTQRLMFGSDYPVCLLAAPYKQWLQTVREYFTLFTLEEQQQIFYNNAANFYQITE